ncbi:MAG: ribose-5-phosphate isomerase RpiA [bacterium]
MKIDSAESLSMNRSKKAAAEKAVAHIREHMTVGLGTGSTTRFAIQILGQKVRDGFNIQGVPTSLESERLAKELNIPLLSEFEHVDLTIDGADEVDRRGNLIKGGGGALTREKIVAAASNQEIIIVDETKLVQYLGRCPLPVEVLPFGWKFVQKKLQALGCEARLRKDQDRVFITDNQNYILDCSFKRIESPAGLVQTINNLPGVVEAGLFIGLTDKVIVGHPDGQTDEIDFN